MRMLPGRSDSPISLSFDSLPRVPLCSSIWVWPSSAGGAAVPSAPVPAIFPWVPTICCSWVNPSTASPEGKDAVFTAKPVFCSLWVAEQDWLLLLVLRGVLGQRSPVGGCSDTGVRKGALLWVGVMLEQGG